MPHKTSVLPREKFRLIFRRRDRARKNIALDIIKSERLQRLGLGLAFHTLGDGVHVQLARHAQHVCDDGLPPALRTAAGKMPRVDAIGVSSAGVYIDNRIMVASLFIKVPDDAFEKRVKNMYLDAAREIAE